MFFLVTPFLKDSKKQRQTDSMKSVQSEVSIIFLKRFHIRFLTYRNCFKSRFFYGVSLKTVFFLKKFQLFEFEFFYQKVFKVLNLFLLWKRLCIGVGKKNFFLSQHFHLWAGAPQRSSIEISVQKHQKWPLVFMDKLF